LAAFQPMYESVPVWPGSPQDSLPAAWQISSMSRG
jgi:hypothetical protein